MRALTKAFGGMVLLFSVFCVNTAYANIEFYQQSFYILGTGSTPQEAAQNAVDQYTQLIISLNAQLGPNEWIDETHIPNEGFLSPTQYYMEVTVIFGVDTGDCGGNGGGNGGAGGGGPG